MAAVTGIIMFMYQGALGTFGVFLRPISEGNGFPISSTVLCITFTSVTGTLLSFVAPPVINKLKPRGCLIVATFAVGLHFWGFAFAHSIWAYWAWAAFVSLTLVFGTQAVIGSIIGRWFIKNRALVMGFVFGAPILGTATWQLIAGFLISRFGFRVAYMIIGSGLIIIALTVNLCFLRMPEQIGQKPLGWEEAEAGTAPENEKPAAPATTAVHADGLTLSEARKTPAYWLIFAGLMLSPMSVGGNNNNAATYLTGGGMSVLRASGFTSLMALLSSPSSAFSGFISQKLGNKIYISYTHVAFILGTAILLLNTSFSTTLMAAFILLYALAAPIGSAMGPTVNSQAFGNRDYTNILTSMAPAGYIGGAIHPVVTSVVLQTGGSLKYVYIVFACLNLGGLILLTSGLAASKRLRDNP